MQHFKDLHSAGQERIRGLVRDRIRIAIDHYVNAAARADRQAFLANGGGAIAVLAYMGATKSAPYSAVLCLAAFSLGIIFCNIAATLLAYTTRKRAEHFASMADAMLNNKISVQEHRDKTSDNAYNWRQFWMLRSSRVSTYGALAMSIIGFFIGIYTIWSSSGAQGATLPA